MARPGLPGSGVVLFHFSSGDRLAEVSYIEDSKSKEKHAPSPWKVNFTQRLIILNIWYIKLVTIYCIMKENTDFIVIFNYVGHHFFQSAMAPCS